jgi:hypothetical protein
MKLCTKCGQETQGHTYCPPCRKEYDAARYRRVRERHKDQAKAWTKRRIQEVQALKRGPCTDCKRSYPTYVMQWDHIGTDKVACISDMAARASLERVMDEISKCELVCANCHAIRTYTRRYGLVGKTRHS